MSKKRDENEKETKKEETKRFYCLLDFQPQFNKKKKRNKGKKKERMQGMETVGTGSAAFFLFLQAFDSENWKMKKENLKAEAMEVRHNFRRHRFRRRCFPASPSVLAGDWPNPASNGIADFQRRPRIPASSLASSDIAC